VLRCRELWNLLEAVLDELLKLRELCRDDMDDLLNLLQLLVLREDQLLELLQLLRHDLKELERLLKRLQAVRAQAGLTVPLLQSIWIETRALQTI
jgi:hypothetical protein